MAHFVITFLDGDRTSDACLGEALNKHLQPRERHIDQVHYFFN